MEVKPVVNDQGQVVDFDVSSGHSFSNRIDPNDYIEQPDGSFQHVYQNVELESDQEDVSTMSFDQNSYIRDLTVAEPELLSAVQWAIESDSVSDSFAQEWDAVVTSCNDLDRLNQMVEQVLEMYRTSNEYQQVEYEEPVYDEDSDEVDDDSFTEVDEWFSELSDEFIDNAVDSIMETQYDQDDVRVMSELSNAYMNDSPEGMILNMGIGIANGSVDPAEAINLVTETFGEAEAARAYVELTQIIVNYQ